MDKATKESEFEAAVQTEATRLGVDREKLRATAVNLARVSAMSPIDSLRMVVNSLPR